MIFNPTTINISALEYSKMLAPEIQYLSKPFLSAFGLTTFLYGRIFYDGRFILLSNNPKWIESWFQKIPTIEGTALHLNLRNTTLGGEPFYFLWDTSSEDELIQIHNGCDVWHGFDINYRFEDSVEGWSFSTSKDKDQINHFYLNNLKLFHRFCFYFRDKASSLIDTKDQKRVAIFKEKIDLSFYSPLPTVDEVNTFLSLLPFEGYSLQTQNGQIRFSKRELECIFHSSHGKTSKEIGRLLSISHRTVESYILSVKHKMGQQNKAVLENTLDNRILKWL